MINNRVPWRIVFVLCATATAGYICRVNISTVGPLLLKELKITETQFGYIISALILGYALFQAPAGALADRFGTRRVLIFSAWLWIATTIVQIFINWGPFHNTAFIALVSFMVFRFILGITVSPMYPATIHGVSQWVLPKYQGRANGIVLSSIGIGSALTLLLVSYIMKYWGWRLAMVGSTIPALIMIFVLRSVKEPDHSDITIPEKTGNIFNKKFSDIFKLFNRSFTFLTISYTLQGYVGYIFVSWFYMYLIKQRHFEYINGAWMASLPWILSIFCIPLGGIFSDRLIKSKLGLTWGSRFIPLTAMILSGIFISIGAHTSNAITAAVCLAFATVFVLCVESPFWTMMLRVSGANSGTAGGLMNMGCNLGGLVSPIITPFVAHYIGWENALHLAAIIAIIAAVLWLGIRPKEE